jgi:hypothetical protein
MPGDRHENIASVKCSRDGRAEQPRIRQLIGGDRTAGLVDRPAEQTIVGSHEDTSGSFHRYRLARATDTRVDNSDMDADRQIRDHPGEQAGTLPDILGRYCVADINDPHLWDDSEQYPVAGRDETIIQPVVREKRDKPVS